MTDNTQPEALRLAEQYDYGDPAAHSNTWKVAVCNELRRQHARIAELESQLESIGAGGVNGPLIGQPQAMPDLSALTERGAKAWAGVDAQGLREGFTAADMATAAAQGFRDGVASASVNSDGSITPGTWAQLKLMMEESAWGGEIQLSDALANVDEFALAFIAASASSVPVAWMTFTEASDPDMVFLDRLEACQYCEDDDPPKPLYLAAPPTAQAEGWRLVPVEPTVAQREAMRKGTGMSFSETKIAYAAMLAAAPTPPTSAEGVEHG